MALGNGPANAGLPLARLLWHLPARAMVSLTEALLLERRILMVAQDKDTVSAAVHGAAALLYPFSWQHIYLPLLPLALKVTSSMGPSVVLLDQRPLRLRAAAPTDHWKHLQDTQSGVQHSTVASGALAARSAPCIWNGNPRKRALCYSAGLAACRTFGTEA